MDGAAYYNVYYDNFSDSSCSVGSNGVAFFCEELAANVTGTQYVHSEPNYEDNYYWVVACNSDGCSEVDSNNPASPVVAKPDFPTDVRYAWEGAAVQVRWEAVVDADYYKVYYDDFFDSACSLGRDGSPRFCDELASNVVEAAYEHVTPDQSRNYYWVVACNRGGCSDVDSENPASPQD